MRRGRLVQRPSAQEHVESPTSRFIFVPTNLMLCFSEFDGFVADLTAMWEHAITKRVLQVLDLYWRSPESGGVWYT